MSFQRRLDAYIGDAESDKHSALRVNANPHGTDKLSIKNAQNRALGNVPVPNNAVNWSRNSAFFITRFHHSAFLGHAAQLPLSFGSRIQMPTLQHIFEVLKLAPRYLAAIGLFCGLILLLPESLANGLGVRDFTQNYRQWLGLAFIGSITLLVVSGCVNVSGVIRERMRLKKSDEYTLKRLHSLTEEEKQILRFYLATESKTNVLRIQDGVVNGLVAAGIIYRISPLGNIHEGFAYNISEFAWEYLHEHHELLEGTTNTYRTDKRDNSRW